MTRYVTPLRYPGGKHALWPFVAEIMSANDLSGGEYAEPYAGGAGVALALLFSGAARRIHLNDISRPVYSFWRSVVSKPDELCRLISSATLSVDEWRRQRAILMGSPRNVSQLELGFSLFYLNRCNRSGIPTGGVIGGLDQTGRWGIDARFPKLELIRRIEAIAAHRSQIRVKNMDAEEFLIDYVSELPSDTLVYCDPPYFHQSGRLYLDHYSPDDHASVADTIQECLWHPWIVSYDTAKEIKVHYRDRRSFTYELRYAAAVARAGRETFFFSDDLRIPGTSELKNIRHGLRQLPHRRRAALV